MANPFDDDSMPPPANSRSRQPYKPITKQSQQNPQDEWAKYEEQIEASMASTLDSTKRSLMMLEESEQTGIKTAESLVHQGEQLRKVDSQLDDINASTAQTQRNLNNIKSVFGGMKNYFSRKPPPITTDDSSSPSTQSLSKKAMSKEEAARARLPAQIEKTRADAAMPARAQASAPGGRTLNEQSRQAIAGTRWEAMDNEIDDNLDLMSANLRRLQGLGQALGDEVSQQNEVLDRINVKTDKTDTTIRRQDDQMKKILGVKDTATPATTIKQSSAAAAVQASGSLPKSVSSGGGWTSKKWF